MTNALNPLFGDKEPLSKDKEAQLDEVNQVEDHENIPSLKKTQILILIMISFLMSLCGLCFLRAFTELTSFPLALPSLAFSWNEESAWLGGDLTGAREYTPEQLHLSLGSNSREMYVTWSTLSNVDGESYVEMCRHVQQYGCFCRKAKVYQAEKSVKYFKATDENWNKLTGKKKDRPIYTYRALIKNLQPDGIYIYRAVSSIKDKGTWYSKSYSFKSRDLSDPDQALSIGFLGDLGLVNAVSVPPLIEEVDSGLHDLFIHNGDFAYDLNTHNGEYGDQFMRMMEPITARVPYQTAVGNHEVASNFSHYDHRFTMVNSGGHDVGKRNNFFYSFNAGPIHFIAFSTEFYYFLEVSGMEALNRQYEWLKRDLQIASSPSERLKRPWIIVFGHRPMYCSSRDRDDCTKDSNLLRRGLPFTGAYALEKLFYDYGVDVQLYSHEHMYERFLPIYDGQVYKNGTSKRNSYQDVKAPVHVISGSAGCQERLDPFMNKTAPGSVKHISDYGFLRIVAERCKIEFAQYSTDQFKPVDVFVMRKSRIQNFPNERIVPELDCTIKNTYQSWCKGWFPNDKVSCGVPK